VTADAERGEQHPGPRLPDDLAHPGGHLGGEPGIGTRDPAAGGVEAEGRVRGPLPGARLPVGDLADAAEQGVPQPEMDHLRPDLGEDLGVLRAPLLEEVLGIGDPEGAQLPAGGQRPGRRSRRREHGHHGDRAAAHKMGEQGAAGQHGVVKVRGHYDRSRARLVHIAHKLA